MIKRLFGGLAAVMMLLSAARAVLAADNVPGSVYGVPRCDNGANSGSKSCLPQDVPDAHFAAKAIADVVKAGLMTTDDTGSFRYDAKLSGGEAVTVMLRLLGLKPEPAKTGNWAAPIISQAADLGFRRQYGP
jgi:hypothetical protein